MNQPPPRTHVCLVSAQPVPNLTPALDPATAPKRVILAVSHDMEGRAGNLERVLRPRGIAVERWPVANPYDVESLLDSFQELAVREAGEDLALNVTGGTKPMAIAAYQAFSMFGLPVFYVHPDFDRLVWMLPVGRPPCDLANRIKLGPFLQAHGAELNEHSATFGMPERLQALAEALVGRVGQYQNALRVLNWAAAMAEDSLTSPRLTPDQLRRGDVQSLLSWFEVEGLITLQGGCIRFSGEDSRFFANGGWLEQYVHARVQELRREKPSIQDVGRALEVSRRVADKAVRNELDVAFLAENRLYVVECKTRHFGPEQDTGSLGAEALYKLETLSNILGGLKARSLLASYQALAPSVVLRARDLGIVTCVGIELQNLKSTLSRWLAGFA